jgi:hypothetical protein
MDIPETDLGDEVMEQIKQQGTASFKVADGEIFVFTTKTLETLLARSIESGDGKVLVFVKTRPTA